MNVVKRFFSFCVATVLAAADTGTPVRPTAADYDARQSLRDATIAATLLTPAQTARNFSRDVSRNFAVVEIAIFPESGRTVDLLTLDFALRVSPDSTNFASTPEEVAWHGKRAPSHSRSSLGVNVIAEAGIAIGTGTNPSTGRTDHGVSAYGGVGVDNRPQPVSGQTNTAVDNTYALEGKLRGLELQEGQITRPASGYLYFPVPKKHGNVAPVLEYSRNGERTKLTLPVH
jgi:hypothetical protein